MKDRLIIIRRFFIMSFLVLTGITDIFGQGRMINTSMPCSLLEGVSSREYSIYLPESYSQNNDRRYPVCYLLHGGNCSCTDWDTYGNVSVLADSLIKNGEMKEMILVCPEGNKNNMIWFNAPHWRYEDFFFDEFMPYIENTYRIDANKEKRFIAGYSMGGGASVVYGLRHPEMFAAVYSMSGYLRRQYLAFLEGDSSAEWRQQLIEDHNPIRTVGTAKENEVSRWTTVKWFIDCGDKDFTYEANIDLIQAFRDKGIEYELRVFGGGHDWNYWKPSLIRMLKYISKIEE